jgi:Fe-S oxidoreductase
MFKDAEQGNKEINSERTEQALDTQAEIIAAACPFCTTMLTDGVKSAQQESKIHIMDVAEMIAQAQNL